MAVVDASTLPREGADRERKACRALEGGHILLFPETPFELTEPERQFLLRRRQAEGGYHKNIAYRPAADRVTGVARQNAEDEGRLRELLRSYSKRVVRFGE